MNRSPLRLILVEHELTICRLPADAPVPAWAVASEDFVSITRTRDELSLVCLSGRVPEGVKQEPGWRALKVIGPLDFSLTGVLVSILEPLARAGISVFSFSTFDTDYVLVKDTRGADAVQALSSAGHTVAVSPA